MTSIRTLALGAVSVLALSAGTAFADGEVDKYEEHLIRRISDLLHVPHRQFIAAKLRGAGQ